MTVLSATRRQIKALPKTQQSCVDAELALVLAKQLDGDAPTAAQAKELRAVLTVLTASLAAADAEEDPVARAQRDRAERRAPAG